MSDQTGQTIVIVGGGISGLSAAWELLPSLAESDRLLVLEGSDRAGGIVRTERFGDFLIEHGPDNFITNKPAAVELCREAGLGDDLIPTNSVNRRSLVLSRGRPVPVPDGFQLVGPSKWLPFLRSPLLSIRGRLRVLLEPLIRVRPGGEQSDESLASFVQRRFGDEALERLVQPLVGGIYTADPRLLSLNATLSRFRQMELSCGSVVHGLRAARRSDRRPSGPQAGDDPGAVSGARYGLFATLRQGMQQLIDTLVDRLRADPRCSVELNAPVARCIPAGDGWEVHREDGTATIHADKLLLATPAPVTARLLRESAPVVSSQLAEIEHASSAIVAAGFRLKDIEHPLDAFGLVIPHREQRRILAVSFSSRKFPGRAPNDAVLLRVFVGGALQPDLPTGTDPELLKLVQEELSEILGVRGDPLWTRVVRYMQAMPQYHVGHLERAETIDREIAGIPNLEVATNATGGVGLPDCIASAREAACRLQQSS